MRSNHITSEDDADEISPTHPGSSMMLLQRDEKPTNEFCVLPSTSFDASAPLIQDVPKTSISNKVDSEKRVCFNETRSPGIVHPITTAMASFHGANDDNLEDKNGEYNDDCDGEGYDTDDSDKTLRADELGYFTSPLWSRQYPEILSNEPKLILQLERAKPQVESPDLQEHVR
ncbi:hypothetical protein CCHL11_00296 [Colletotrichum chlorophyti]|uniref:Uncharacterized protein n=1 Tax=Colletotrichum chlorophyti TaxID=708187 RepID=A0A1Q8RU89_9PEZI|nr:hypothetical protein CCHL11_00296 [Colletotrichum chlorophyti]